MIKTIKIDNKEVRLSNNVSWALIYKNQFGSDIVQALMPMIAGALDILSGLVKETDEINLKDLAKITDGDDFINAMIHIGNVEFTDFIDITWALAKAADDDIPEPMEWVKQFDSFPMDTIAPAVVGLIVKGLVSSKNLRKLNDLKKKVQLSNLTTSSSQESNEG